MFLMPAFVTNWKQARKKERNTQKHRECIGNYLTGKCADSQSNMYLSLGTIVFGYRARPSVMTDTLLCTRCTVNI